MDVELKLSSLEDAHMIKNLWPLYLHDISQFEGVGPNQHGVLWAEDDVRTLAEQGDGQNTWWEKPDVLFPYLILADGLPVGFNLVATGGYVPEGVRVDYVIYGFFVTHSHRGKGVAERAAIESFERHKGRWEVVTYPGRTRAVAFWRRVLTRFAREGLCESEGAHPWGRRVIFLFDSGPPSPNSP